MLTVPGPFKNKSTPSAWLPFLTLYLAFACCLAACTHKLAPIAHYQVTPVVADGIPDDWPLPLRFTNADYTLQYNINTPSGLRNMENPRHRGGRGLGLGMNGMHMRGGHRNNGNDGISPPIREDASWCRFRFAVR